jgi:asparagine synthase (glutamine-hydrolysing)
VRGACDLAGLGVHFPMLDPAVVEVSTRVPSADKLTLRQLRKFYKDAFRSFLPAEVTAKVKHGFGVPVGIWINEDAELRERVDSRLRSLAHRGIVRPDFIADLTRRQQAEHATYYGTLTWWLFMLEEWMLAHRH